MKIIDEWTWTERDTQIAEVKRHNIPHTEACCGEVAKIPHWVAYRSWLEQKITKSLAKFKNKSIL